MGKIINDLIEQKLYELMEKSSFESLSDEEKEFVREYSSEDEYNVQRNMMQELFEFESEVYSDKVPSKTIDLPSDKKGSKIKKLFTFNVPSYAVAASLILAIALPQFMNKKQLKKNYSIEEYAKVEEKQLIEKPKDSIFTELKEQFVQKEKKTKAVLLADSFQNVKIQQSIETTLERPKGRTAKNDPYEIFYSSL